MSMTERAAERRESPGLSKPFSRGVTALATST